MMTEKFDQEKDGFPRDEQKTDETVLPSIEISNSEGVDGNGPAYTSSLSTDMKETSVPSAPEPPQLVFFAGKYTYKTHVHQFSLENTPVIVRVGDSKHCEISLYEIVRDDGSKETGLTITGHVSAEISQRQFSVLMDKIEGGGTISKYDEDNKIANVVKSFQAKCEDMIQRIFGLIRWRFNISGDNNKLITREYVWSYDKASWLPVNCCEPPSAAMVTMIAGVKLSKQEIATEIESLIQADESEPIYHTLIREARAIQFVSPQSAFVLATTALEVAVKHFIARKVPLSEWLISNLPSPDIHRIMKEYFPVLDDQFIIIEKKLAELKNITNNRNTMVHAGKINFDTQRIADSISLIIDFIKKIDFHSGWTWSA